MRAPRTKYCSDPLYHTNNGLRQTLSINVWLSLDKHGHVAHDAQHQPRHKSKYPAHTRHPAAPSRVHFISLFPGRMWHATMFDGHIAHTSKDSTTGSKKTSMIRFMEHDSGTVSFSMRGGHQVVNKTLSASAKPRTRSDATMSMTVSSELALFCKMGASKAEVKVPEESCDSAHVPQRLRQPPTCSYPYPPNSTPNSQHPTPVLHFVRVGCRHWFHLCSSVFRFVHVHASVLVHVVVEES